MFSFAVRRSRRGSVAASQTRMFACCKCAQWNLCHVGLDFTKLPLPKRLFSLLVFPQFELNSFFRLVLYLPGTEGKKLSTGFAGFCVSFAV